MLPSLDDNSLFGPWTGALSNNSRTLGGRYLLQTSQWITLLLPTRCFDFYIQVGD